MVDHESDNFEVIETFLSSEDYQVRIDNQLT